MADVAAMAISAAGSIAGGKAANALTDRNAPKGGGIPGLTTSIGGKKDGSQDAIQVDPSIALDYFRQASEAHTKGYNEGLAYYLPALDKASKQMQMGYSGANATLKPLSTSAGEALNQQLKFLGLDPIQKTAGYGDALRTTAYAYGDNLPELSSYANDLANQMDEATNIKDPAERAAAKASILDKMRNAETNINKPLQDKLSAIGANSLVSETEIDQILKNRGIDPNIKQWDGTKLTTNKQMYLDKAKTSSSMSAGSAAAGYDSPYYLAATDYNKLLDSKQQQNTKNEADKKALQEQINTNKDAVAGLDPFISQFEQGYGAQYDKAYTGQEIADAVSNLPGYQFQYEQGAKGLERAAAAKGMLKSANTQLALQEFGQQQAQSYYNNYMQQLSGQVAQGTPATMQISANQQGLGASLSNLAQMYGAAQMDTARANADFLSGQLMQSGSLFNQTAMFNAGQQNQAIQNSLQREADQKKANTAAGPGYINAQVNQGMLGLAQSKFLQEQQASRNGAAGYFAYGGY